MKINSEAENHEHWQIQVCCQGLLDYWIQDTFGSAVTMTHGKDGTVLCGHLPDISAVYGFVLQLRDSGAFLSYLSVKKILT